MRCKCGSQKIEEVAVNNVYLFTDEDRERFQQWECEHCGHNWVTEIDDDAIRVGIVGSRNFIPLSSVEHFVNHLPDNTIVVSGGARGVDKTAEIAAEKRGLKTLIFPVNAPPKATKWEFAELAKERNQMIINNSDVVVAFWDGKSGGTADSIQRARKANIPLITIDKKIKRTKIIELAERMNVNQIPEVIVYCDGAAQPNPGKGGWGAVLIFGKHTKEIRGGIQYATNNEMEIRASIGALKALNKKCKVIIYSDSQYLVNTMERGWNRNSNNHLWEMLDELVEQHEVRFEWVRGHNGNQHNERAHDLSMQAIKELR